MRIFVTGASGLLGSELSRQLAKKGHLVISGYNIHQPTAGQPIQIDLTNLDGLEKTIKDLQPDTIIHTASLTDVDLCEEEPALAETVNGQATGRIGQAASDQQAFVVYISTDYVFDGRRGQYREEDQPNPINQYGRTKLLGEQLLKESNCRFSIARTSVVYGWGREHRPNFATWIINRLESNQTVQAVTGNETSPTLNLNLAEMIADIAENQIEGILHVAGATRISRYEFAIRVAETFGLNRDLVKPAAPDSIPWKAKRPADSSLNVDKARKVLNTKPLELKAALERFRTARR